MGNSISQQTTPYIQIDPTQHCMLIDQTEYYKVYKNNTGIQYQKYQVTKHNNQPKHTITHSQQSSSSQQNNQHQYKDIPNNSKPSFVNNFRPSFEQHYQYRLTHRSKYFVQLLYAAPKESSFTCNFVQATYQVVTERIMYRLSQLYTLSFANAIKILNIALKGFRNLFIYNGAFWIKDTMIGINQNNQVKVWLNTNYGLNSIQQLPVSLLRLSMQQKQDLIVNNLIDMISSKTYPSTEWRQFMRMRMDMLSNKRMDMFNIKSMEMLSNKKMTFVLAIQLIEIIIRKYKMQQNIDDNKVYDLFNQGDSKNKKKMNEQHDNKKKMSRQEQSSLSNLKISQNMIVNSNRLNNNNKVVDNRDNVNSQRLIRQSSGIRSVQKVSNLQSNNSSSSNKLIHTNSTINNPIIPHNNGIIVNKQLSNTNKINHLGTVGYDNVNRVLSNPLNIKNMHLNSNSNSNSNRFIESNKNSFSHLRNNIIGASAINNNTNNSNINTKRDSNSNINFNPIKQIRNSITNNTLSTNNNNNSNTTTTIITNPKTINNRSNNLIYNNSSYIVPTYNTNNNHTSFSSIIKPQISLNTQPNYNNNNNIYFNNNSNIESKVSQVSQINRLNQQLNQLNNSRSVVSNSRSVSSSNVKFTKPPPVRFSHSMDKPIIVNHIKNNQRQSFKVNFLNNSIVHRSPHYYNRQSKNNNSPHYYNRSSINTNSPSIKQLRQSELIFDDSPVKYQKIAHYKQKQIQLLNNQTNSIKNKQQINEKKQINTYEKKINKYEEKINKYEQKINNQTQINKLVYEKQNIFDSIQRQLENTLKKQNINLSIGSIQKLQQLKQQPKQQVTVSKIQQTNIPQSSQEMNKQIIVYTYNNHHNQQSRINNQNNQQLQNSNISIKKQIQDHQQQYPIRVTINRCPSQQNSQVSNNQSSNIEQFHQLVQQRQRNNQTNTNININETNQEISLRKDNNLKSKQQQQLCRQQKDQLDDKVKSSSSGQMYRFNLKQTTHIFNQHTNNQYSNQQSRQKINLSPQKQFINYQNQLYSTLPLSINQSYINNIKTFQNNNIKTTINNPIQQHITPYEQHQHINKYQQNKQQCQQNNQKQYNNNYEKQDSKQKHSQKSVSQVHTIINKLNKWENKLQNIQQPQLNSFNHITKFKKHLSHKQQPILSQNLYKQRHPLNYSTLETNTNITSIFNNNQFIDYYQKFKKHQHKTQENKTITNKIMLTQVPDMNTLTYKQLRDLLKSTATNYSTTPQQNY